MARTKKVVGNSTGPGNQAQLRFNEPACSDKVSEAGLNYFYGASNAEGLLGGIVGGVTVPKFRPILLLNNTGALAYVAFGDSGLAAPTGPTDGVPILDGQVLMLNSGDNIRVRSSAASVVFAYAAEENIIE